MMRRLMARAAATLALSLVLAAGAPALAQESCGGGDLIARMKREDPQRLARLEQEAKAVPFGAARLFRLTKGRARPSYLFGTMHSSDPRAFAWIDQIEPRIAEARIVAIENTQVDPGRLDPAARFKLATMMIAKPDQLLERHLDAEELERIAETAAPKMAMSPAAAKRLRPWALMLALAYSDCETKRSRRDGVVDFMIVRRAELLSKPAQGLETVEDMLKALNAPPMEAQIDALRSAQTTHAMIQDMFETMTRILDRGETGFLTVYARDESVRTMKDPANFDIVMRALLDQRNETMFRNALPLTERGGAFIAVGALHLPGEKGLAKMFADAGYRVEPIMMERTTQDE